MLNYFLGLLWITPPRPQGSIMAELPDSDAKGGEKTSSLVEEGWVHPRTGQWVDEGSLPLPSKSGQLNNCGAAEPALLAQWPGTALQLTKHCCFGSIMLYKVFFFFSFNGIETIQPFTNGHRENTQPFHWARTLLLWTLLSVSLLCKITRVLLIPWVSHQHPERTGKAAALAFFSNHLSNLLQTDTELSALPTHFHLILITMLCGRFCDRHVTDKETRLREINLSRVPW